MVNWLTRFELKNRMGEVVASGWQDISRTMIDALSDLELAIKDGRIESEKECFTILNKLIEYKKELDSWADSSDGQQVVLYAEWSKRERDRFDKTLQEKFPNYSYN